jgi:aldehyde dehydrogenase (NAD+)
MVDLPSVPNWIDGRETPAGAGESFAKTAPATGEAVSRAARSRVADVAAAVAAAKRAQPAWAERTPVARGDILRQTALLLRERAREISEIVALETGKSPKDALGETGAAVEMGFFVAGEGRRFYGRTTTSAVPNKKAEIVRQPIGVAALIVPANTPLPNIAWKAFPALLCGNAAVLKSSEDAPGTALAFARALHDAGLPAGAFNVVHGFGEEAGAPLVGHADVNLVSFTGSVEVGRRIAQQAGRRLAKTCLELGGKNPLIVCDDADVENAAQAAALSAFSNAGQRCASGSRLIVFDAVYDRFRQALLDRAAKLKLGVADTDDLGPVVNEESLTRILAELDRLRAAGAKILCGGRRAPRPGFYVEPTILENVAATDPASCTELFGPVTALYRAKDFHHAIALANDSPFALTASIHTKSIHRAMTFLAQVQAGVAIVNGPTYGSEPHMPFGGLKQSGTGSREAGTEALDVYSEWKTIYINHLPGEV